MNLRFTLVYIISFLLYNQFALGQYRTKSSDWNMNAYEKHVFTDSTGKMYYRLLPPTNVDPNKKYPLVIMLHGKGEGLGQPCSVENGPNYCNLLWGGQMHLDSINKYPSYVVFPQTSGGDWTSDKPITLLTRLMEYLTKTYNIDLDRIQIHGLSAGGSGVWKMLYLHPNFFAGASPMSASGNTSFAPLLKYNPIWTVQGGLDTNPKPANSVAMIDALRKEGDYALFTLNENLAIQEWPSAKTDRDPIYTLAPYEEHESWPTLYNSHSWLGWLYNQNKNRIVVIGRTTIAPGEATKLGVSPGFQAYQWSTGDTTNEITVNASGNYSVRYLRKANLISGPLVWSAWSAPVTITVNSSAPVIADAGKDQRIVLPTTTARLRGFGAGANIKYKWTKVTGGVVTMSSATTNTCVLSNLQFGKYTFRLTVTDSYGKTAADDISLNVSSDTIPQAVTSFTLVNAITDSDIREIKDGDVISLSSLPTQSINIRANTDPPRVGSVILVYDGLPRLENGSPYTLFGDTDGNYSTGNLLVGSHNLIAVPYKNSNAGGTQGNYLSISFTVVQTSNTKLAAITDEETDQNTTYTSIDSNLITLYPNPVDDKVNISFSYKQSNVMIYLYDDMGYLVRQQELQMFGEENYGELYMVGLQPGLYRLRITSDKIPNKVIPILKN